MTVKLDVKYRYQNDNSPSTGQGEGWRQCNLTCCAMLADAARKKHGFVDLDELASINGFSQGEDYYASIVSRYGDTTYHNVQTNALKDVRILSEYVGMDDDEIKNQLDSGYPVVAGVKYKSGGHIVCIVGYDETGYWVHDPYGSRHGASNSYTINPTAGEYDKYSYGLWNRVRDWMGRKVTGFNED